MLCRLSSWHGPWALGMGVPTVLLLCLGVPVVLLLFLLRNGQSTTSWAFREQYVDSKLLWGTVWAV